jgi:SNF2-related domain
MLGCLDSLVYFLAELSAVPLPLLLGAGKTIEILGLIVATLTELKLETIQHAGENKMVHATLIIVPPALVSQWQNEIIKCTGDTLILDIVDGQTGAVIRQGSSICTDTDADIVLTTYQALVHRMVAPNFHAKRWGRIVLDEMQEIRSSTTAIAKTCERLDCNRRWMLSGTPLFDGIDDLRGELNFLRLEPFSANSEDGFFDFMIAQPWKDHNPVAIDTLKVLSSVMLRRSKDMTIKLTGASILDLKPLTVEFVPVQQTNSERAIYYFLESVLARGVAASSVSLPALHSKKLSDMKNANASHKISLRLLRETCNSVVTLNGGLGVSSQLKALNDLLILVARSAKYSDRDQDRSRREVLSCDEAIIHLAQVQHSIRTHNSNEEVAFLSLGFGQGLSKRLRANDSVDQKLVESHDKLQNAYRNYREATSQRAKARWLLSLERITMGEIPIENLIAVQHKFRSLWRWRFMTCALRKTLNRAHFCPLIFRRGWRPSSTLAKEWHQIHPEFFWSHPNSFVIPDIPNTVSDLDVLNTIANVFVAMGTYDCLETARKNFLLIVRKKYGTGQLWDAGLQFEHKDAALAVLHKAASTNGIVVENTANIPQMQEVVSTYQAAYDEVHDLYLVHPTDNNYVNQKKKSKALKLAKLGLRIVRGGKVDLEVKGAVPLSPAHRPYRNCTSNFFSQEMYESTGLIIAECSNTIYESTVAIRSEEEKIIRLTKVKEKGLAGTNEAIGAMSAFEILEALANGQQEETCCCICLDFLGSTVYDGLNTAAATISMIDCGHLYCRQCLEGCSNVCPSCRKEFELDKDVTHIDIELKKKRNEGEKHSLHDASRMLERSDGVLEPEMWDCLYHAIGEAIPGAYEPLDIRVSAIPRHFLGHLRACIKGLDVMSKPSNTPDIMDQEHSVLSTKVKALLHDLPVDERSVVFSTYNSTIMVKFMYLLLIVAQTLLDSYPISTILVIFWTAFGMCID